MRLLVLTVLAVLAGVSPAVAHHRDNTQDSRLSAVEQKNTVQDQRIGALETKVAALEALNIASRLLALEELHEEEPPPPPPADSDGDGFPDSSDACPNTAGVAPDGCPAPPPPPPTGCTQTLSVGANLVSAVANAANGSTICLNNGDYGTVNWWDLTRSGYVTVKSVSGRGASLRPSIGNADYIRLESLTLRQGLVNSCSTNIQVADSTFQQDMSGLYFDASTCPSTVHNYLVDNVTFANVDLTGFEGRLSFRDTNGVTVKNSTFGPNGYGDGIQTGGNNRNLTIGPNNRFTGISQSFCDANGGAHCDSIQLQGGGATTITGNHFSGSDVFIMAPDGSSNVTTTNNVFDGQSSSYEYKIQFGTAASPVFRHNTLANTSAAFDSKTGNPATTNAIVRDNVWSRGHGQIKTSNGSGCSGCAFSHNLFENGANARGTSNVVGAPVFVGPLTTYAGWRLASGSPGKGAASDGTDIGIP
jgi:hypothetical protein